VRGWTIGLIRTLRFDFFDGLAAIPFHGVGHGGLERIEIGGGTPADVVMLGLGKRHRAVFGPCPVNHANVLVGIRDAVNVEKARRNQGARAGFGGGRAFAEELDVQAAFLFSFAQRGDFRVFVEFNVAANGQPFVQLAMMDQKDFAVLNDENRHGEINFFMDVRHNLAASLALESRRVNCRRRENFRFTIYDLRAWGEEAGHGWRKFQRVSTH
jgi:hypothetical protein